MIALCLWFALFPVVAPPSSPDANLLARQHFEEAESAFGRGDFLRAAQAFERAFGLSPHSATLLNAAEAWERAGQLARAYNTLTRVLRIEAVDPSARVEAERRLERLEPRVGRLRLVGGPGQTVEIDGNGERLLLPVTVAVEPGARAVAAFDNASRPIERRIVTATKGETVEVFFAATADIDTHDDAPQEVNAQSIHQGEVAPKSAEFLGFLPSPPAASVVLFGGAGAAFVSTAIFGGLTLGAKETYDAAPSQENADRFFSHRRATNVSVGVGVALVAAATTWWLFDSQTESRLGSPDGEDRERRRESR